MTESPEENKGLRQRYRSRNTDCIHYIGNCKAITTYLSSKDGIEWLPPKFLNALLRGIAQVAFMDNPISGILVLVALIWSNVQVGLAAIVAGTTAIISSVFLRQDSSLISSGLTSFNAVLVGVIPISLWRPLYSEDPTVKLWVFIILGSVFSVFLISALNNLLSSCKIALPYLTAPFNIVVLLLFTCLMPSPIVTSSDNYTTTTVGPDMETESQLQMIQSQPKEIHNLSLQLNSSQPLNLSQAQAISLIQLQSQESQPSVLSHASLATNWGTSASSPSSVSPVAPHIYNRMARRVENFHPKDKDSIRDDTLINNSNVSSYPLLMADSSEVATNNNETSTNFLQEDINETVGQEESKPLDWGGVFTGVICSMGQVYGTDDLLASILIYVAVVIYSPFMCLMFLVGAAVGSVTGSLFAPAPLDSVYNGLWGFNGILSAGAVGGLYIVITWYSFLTAVANVLFTVLIQQALVKAFMTARLPVFTVPFVLSTLIFLSVTSSGEQLPRVFSSSYPEKHRREFLEERHRRKLETAPEEHIEEEKGLVLDHIRVQEHNAIATGE